MIQRASLLMSLHSTTILSNKMDIMRENETKIEHDDRIMDIKRTVRLKIENIGEQMNKDIPVLSDNVKIRPNDNVDVIQT